MKISLNEPECECLGLFRMALSEETDDDRSRAIEVMRHEVVSLGLENFPISNSTHLEFINWTARTAQVRYNAGREFYGIAQRFDSKNELKLNIAEYIGKLVWESIATKRFQGLHVKGGILDQTRDFAKKNAIHGARDKDVLRKIWKAYRGVVHLGMAMDYSEQHPETTLHVLQIAETFRAGLASNHPKGWSEPYVASERQISFEYITRL